MSPPPTQARSHSQELVRLNELWNTRRATRLDSPVELVRPDSPLEWALAICQRDVRLISTVMKSALKGVSSEVQDAMIYASRGGASEATRKMLIQGVRDAAPIQLQVDQLESFSTECADFFHSCLVPTLKQVHPYGFSSDMSLFTTGGGHLYNAHCDLGDGFLFQLAGRKLARLWGPADSYWEEVVFDHDFRGRQTIFSGPEVTVELVPGQVLFLPRGVMHEIRVPDDDQSVSIAMRVEHLYPVLTLVEEVLGLLGRSDGITVPPEAGHWDKFRALVFDPSAFPPDRWAAEKGMPTLLKQRLLSLLQASGEGIDLKSGLDLWWRDLDRRRNYSPTGPLPRQPKGKQKELAAWETERLKRNS